MYLPNASVPRPAAGVRRAPCAAAMPTSSSARRQLQHELPELLVQLGALRDELEAGPVSHFRRWRLARQAKRLEGRLVELRARRAPLLPERDSQERDPGSVAPRHASFARGRP